MPKTRQAWMIMTIVVAVVGSVWAMLNRVPVELQNPSGRPPAPQAGHLAPDFTLTMEDGEQIALSDFRGTPVVLNFWATWCGPCRAEMPAFESIWRESDGQVQFIGVNVQESAAQVSAFATGLGISYPLPLDPNAAIARVYRVRAFPTTLFIDEQGVIQEMILGQVNEPSLDANVSNLLEN